MLGGEGTEIEGSENEERECDEAHDVIGNLYKVVY